MAETYDGDVKLKVSLEFPEKSLKEFKVELEKALKGKDWNDITGLFKGVEQAIDKCTNAVKELNTESAKVTTTNAVKQVEQEAEKATESVESVSEKTSDAIKDVTQDIESQFKDMYKTLSDDFKQMCEEFKLSAESVGQLADEFGLNDIAELTSKRLPLDIQEYQDTNGEFTPDIMYYEEYEALKQRVIELDRQELAERQALEAQYWAEQEALQSDSMELQQNSALQQDNNNAVQEHTQALVNESQATQDLTDAQNASNDAQHEQQQTLAESDSYIAGLVAKIQEWKAELKELENAGYGLGTERYDDLTASIAMGEEELKNYRSTLLETSNANEESANTHHLFTSAVEASGSALSRLKSLLGRVGSLLRRTFTRQNAQNANFINEKNLKKGLNLILKYVIGIRSLYMLFRKVRTMAKQALQELAKESDVVNKDISSLLTNWSQFKNSIGAIIQPILHVVTPALNMLMDVANKASEAIAQFFAVLSGQDFFYKATKVQKDYAASLDKTSKSAKEASKQLGSYDKLEVISKQDSGDGSGSGQEALFEKVETPVSDLAERLKAMVEAGDWNGLGALFAEKLNTLTAKFNDWVLNVLTPRGPEITGSVAEFINGFVGQFDGMLTGQTFGNTFNAILDTLTEFWKRLDGLTAGRTLGDIVVAFFDTAQIDKVGTYLVEKWNTLIDIFWGFTDRIKNLDIGKDLAGVLNKLIHDVDWNKLAESLSNGVKTLLANATSFIENTDWFDLGAKILEFVRNIDWDGIFDKLCEGAGAALGGIGSFILGLITDALIDAYDYFGQQIEDAGGNIVEGMLVGIANILVNIGTWVKEHIFKPFIDGIKKAFRIGSPSKEMEEQGGFIADGLLGGIKGKIDDIIGVFKDIKDGIVEVVTEIATFVSDKFTDIKDAMWNTMLDARAVIFRIWDGFKTILKTPINAIISIFEFLANGVVNGLNMAIKAINLLSVDIPSWVPGVGGKTFGFDISTIPEVELPRLAQGAVIPANREFLALLGDQKQGTNIEAPLETIEQALRNVLAERGGSNGQSIVLNLDGRTVAEVVWDETEKKYKQTGVRLA